MPIRGSREVLSPSWTFVKSLGAASDNLHDWSSFRGQSFLSLGLTTSARSGRFTLRVLVPWGCSPARHVTLSVPLLLSASAVVFGRYEGRVVDSATRRALPRAHSLRPLGVRLRHVDFGSLLGPGGGCRWELRATARSLSSFKGHRTSRGFSSWPTPSTSRTTSTAHCVDSQWL